MRLEWHEWRNAAVKPDLLAELKTPVEFDAASRDVTPEEMVELISLVTRGNELLDLLDECATCGFDEIYVHNVSRNQHGFMDFMAKEVFSQMKLRGNSPSRNDGGRLYRWYLWYHHGRHRARSVY
ncbi:hypothetical protein [Neorhizobium sp. AL 9.2.2]|uniref:hypothetical protein n=1 Tax=Neorhizobium sp. AL 9.2.2 TaxID=2712894 RepID=UPI003530419A